MSTSPTRLAGIILLLAAMSGPVPLVAQERGGGGGGAGRGSPADHGPGGAERAGRGESRSGRGSGSGSQFIDEAPPPAASEREQLPDFGAKDDPAGDLQLPSISGYAPAVGDKPLAQQGSAVVKLSAQMVEDGPDIPRGLVWRIFKVDGDAEGKLPLVASSRGGTSTFQLEPGAYLVHAAFGRAGATKRITVTREGTSETLMLDAGGLKLHAVAPGGLPVKSDQLKFSIYEGSSDAPGERPLIAPDVSPDAIVRLNAGVYHVVSTYGGVNAVVRTDIRVEAGKLTDATVEHRAAQLTLKLVREAGGEAMADTSWSVLNEGGDAVREAVGPYASMVLAEGNYTIVAKNRDRIYQRDLSVTPGDDEEVEVLASETLPAEEGAD